jgi:hypothetical protein
LRTSTFVPGNSGDRVCASAVPSPPVSTPPSYEAGVRMTR